MNVYSRRQLGASGTCALPRRDLSAAKSFQQVLQATSVFNNERMAWLGFAELA